MFGAVQNSARTLSETLKSEIRDRKEIASRVLMYETFAQDLTAAADAGLLDWGDATRLLEVCQKKTKTLQAKLAFLNSSMISKPAHIIGLIRLGLSGVELRRLIPRAIPIRLYCRIRVVLSYLTRTRNAL